MKNFFAVCILVISLQAGAQDAEIKPAAKGVVYGESVGQEGTIVTPDQLQAKMVNGVFEGRVTGKVTEVSPQENSSIESNETKRDLILEEL